MQDMLNEDIKAEEQYNLGGISSILLLDMKDFWGYEFEDDKLYDEAKVDKIFRTSSFFELDVVSESRFTEIFTDGTYKQELNSFVRVIDGETICWLEEAQLRRFIVVFRTMHDRYFVFGSDGGVKLSYSGQTGKIGEVNGLSISLPKNSVLPLFEVDKRTIFEVPSEFIPQFDYYYCLSSGFVPQFDNYYCINPAFRPLFDSFKCITN